MRDPGSMTGKADAGLAVAGQIGVIFGQANGRSLVRHLEAPDVMRHRIFWLALLLLAPGLAAADNDDAGFFYYDPGGEKVTLTPVPWVFGAFVDTPVRAYELIRIVNAAGYRGARISEFNMNGWLVELRNASDPPPLQGVSDMIATFLDLDRSSLFYFTPAFATASGDVVYIAPWFEAVFEDGVDEQRVDDLVATAAVPVAEKIPPSPYYLGNTYFFETHHRSALEVLDSINRLALFPEVVYVYPGITYPGVVNVGGGGGLAIDVPALSPSGAGVLGLAVAVAAVAVLRRRRALRPR